jgi:DNA-binding response OmpR family regulator
VTLLEIVLPEEGGVQVAERLRGRTTLIAVTGIDYEDFQRCYPSAGFSHYLQKPVNPELLHHAPYTAEIIYG